MTTLGSLATVFQSGETAATVIFYNDDKGFGFLSSDDGEIHLGAGIVRAADVDPADLVPGARLRVAFHTTAANGRNSLSATEIVGDVQEPETFVGTIKVVTEKGFGFIHEHNCSAFAGMDVFLPKSVIEAAGVAPDPSLRGFRVGFWVTSDRSTGKPRAIVVGAAPEDVVQQVKETAVESAKADNLAPELQSLEVGFSGNGKVVFIGKGFCLVGMKGFEPVFVRFSASAVRVKMWSKVNFEVTERGNKGLQGKITGKHSSEDGVAGEVAPAPAEAAAPAEVEAPTEVTVGQLRARKGKVTKARNAGDKEALDAATATLQDLVKQAQAQGGEVAETAKKMAKDMGIDTTEAVVLQEPAPAKSVTPGGVRNTAMAAAFADAGFVTA